MDRYTPLYSKWVTNKDTWNSAQCWGSQEGRGLGGKWIHAYICVAESLCCSPETITALLIGYTPVQNKKFKKKLYIHLFTYLQTCSHTYTCVCCFVYESSESESCSVVSDSL